MLSEALTARRLCTIKMCRVTTTHHSSESTGWFCVCTAAVIIVAPQTNVRKGEENGAPKPPRQTTLSSVRHSARLRSRKVPSLLT